MVATTGRFTGPASEYADRLRQNGDSYPIELIDGEDLREIADEIGLDLYNARIEILCDETLRATLLRMIATISVDVVGGSVPYVGTLFDSFWKANVRNVERALADLAEPRSEE